MMPRLSTTTATTTTTTTLPLLYCSLLLLVVTIFHSSHAFTFTTRTPLSLLLAPTTTTTITTRRNSQVLWMSTPTIIAENDKVTAKDMQIPSLLSSFLALALQKPSKTLTVGLEVVVPDDGIRKLSQGDVSTLSMQLRQCQANTIWTFDPQIAKIVREEQSSAQGNFPGPCPIIWNGDLAEARELQVDAVVVSPSNNDHLRLISKFMEQETDIVWKVDAASDIETVTTMTDDKQAFLVDANNDHLESILEALPCNAIKLVAIQSMQPDNAELSLAKSMKTNWGVHGIVLQQAIVGDVEDLEYTQLVVAGATKKQSSTFNMSGLTGSTNGHFGGVSTSVAKTWRRTQQQQQ